MDDDNEFRLLIVIIHRPTPCHVEYDSRLGRRFAFRMSARMSIPPHFVCISSVSLRGWLAGWLADHPQPPLLCAGLLHSRLLALARYRSSEHEDEEKQKSFFVGSDHFGGDDDNSRHQPMGAALGGRRFTHKSQ